MGCIMQAVFLKGERVYDGKIFKLKEHTERLFYSAGRMENYRFLIVKKKLTKLVKK